MTIKENLVIVTKSKTFESCDNIKIFYESGKAVVLKFTCNGGNNGAVTKPEEITDFFDKESNLNLLKDLRAYFSISDASEIRSINQKIFINKIKRYLMK